MRERIAGLSKFETANLNQQSTIRKLEEQLAESRSKQSEYEEKSGALIHANSENEKLVIKIDSLQKSLTSFTARNTSLDEQNLKLQDQLSALDKQKFELVKNVQNLELRQSESREAAKELERLRRQSRQQNLKIESLSSDLVTAQQDDTQAKQAESTIAKQSSKITALEKNVADLQSTLENTEDKQKEQFAQVEKYKAKSSGLIAEVERAKSQAETLNKKISTLETDVSASESRLQAMSKVRDSLQHEKTSLETDIIDVRARFREQSNLLEETSKALDSSKNEYKTAQEKAQTEIAKLQSSVKTSADSNNSINKEIAALRQSNKSLEDKLTLTTNKSEGNDKALAKSKAELQQAVVQQKMQAEAWKKSTDEFKVREQDLNASVSSLKQGLQQKHTEIDALSDLQSELELKTK